VAVARPGGPFRRGTAIGQLNQDASAVAHELVCAHGTPVIEVFKNLQTLLDDGMAFFALDVGHKADATGVMFGRWIVQTVLLQVVFFGSRGHGVLLNQYVAGMRSIVQCSKVAKLFN
jgi:hypothetical protein